ncbi:MAG: ATP-binding protein [Gammaproteobacteria bacterium]|nr:ATP-binding protein [Gammaproteobacteria bacterium]
MYINRKITILDELQEKSVFLLGPRQTGKSSFIRNKLSEARVYNLLESDTFLKLNQAPQRIREELTDSDKIIVIDEIQRFPTLLNEVHLMIEEHDVRFLLTGSSARKLRRVGVNLLGGRARMRHLHPFSFSELGDAFDLNKAINYGLLPSIYLSSNPEADLNSYIGLYLQEEIVAESATRNIPAFSRFLQVAALCNGKIINYSNIANDAQVARTTIQEYFQILKDTLLAFEIPAWKQSLKRKPISTSKFYFFDMGVTRLIQNRALLNKGSPEYGEAFESYICHELKTFIDYTHLKGLNYWRSKSGFEVDFIISNEIAIEVKAKDNVSLQDIKGIKALQEEKKHKHYIVVSFEKTTRMVGGIQILPWKIFLEKLWGREFI